MADGGRVVIKAILDDSQILKSKKRIESELKDAGANSFDGLQQDARQSAEQLDETADSAKKADEKLSGLKSGAASAGDALRVGLAGAAVAAGAAIFATASDYEAAQGRIQAALGVSADEAERFKEIGATIYQGGWGDSLDQVTDALIQTKSTIRDIDEQGLEKVTTNALALEKVFRADVNESIRGTNALMEGFGLNAQEASDLLAAGMQRGLNYTDELGDNLSEYAVRWGDAGMSASQYFSLLEAGTANGAYNLDKVGDFLNEFLTSLSDGRMEENIGRLSTGTQEVFANFKAGKATAEDVLNAVIGELQTMTDETERASFASDVWSSLGEDNAMKMVLALGNVQDTFGNVEGASDQVAESMEQTFGQKMQSAARTLGGAVEKLGDPLLNIAEYAADLIKAFAEWFGSLDEGTQRAVVSFAAVGAAVGPVSRGIDTVKKAAEGAGGAVSAAADIFRSFAESVGIAGDSAEGSGRKTEKATGKFKAAGSAMSASAGMAGVFAAAIVYLGVEAYNAYREMETFNKATEGLGEVASGSVGALQSAGTEVSAYGKSAAQVAQEVDELIQKQAEWVDTLTERESEVAGTVAQLDGYRDTINDLAGKTDLTAGEQAKLQAALDGVNDACGTSYTVAKDAAGAYQIMADGATVAKDEINKLIEAQQYQVRYDAYSESYAEAMKQEADAAATLANAKARQAEAQKKVNDALDAGWTPDMMGQYNYELEQANAALSDAQGAYDAAAGAMGTYEERLTNAKIAMDNLDGGYAAFLESNQLLSSMILESGYSLEQFRASLEQTGVSTETLNSLSQEQLTGLAEAYDGTVTSITGKLSEYGVSMTESAQLAMQTASEMTGYSVEQLTAMAQEFGLQGDAAMAAFGNAIAAGTEPALAAVSALTGRTVQDLQNVADQAGIKGDEAMQKYTAAIQAGYDPVYAALSSVTGMEAQQLQDAASNAGISGDAAMSNYVDAINRGVSPATAAAAAVRGVTVDQLAQAAREAGYEGSDAVDEYSRAIMRGENPARNAASSVASSASSGLSSRSGSASTSGSHLVSNFASGILGAVGLAVSAARSVAIAAANILQFSVPKEGPWSGGERGGERSGEHLVQNIARGIANAAPQLQQASLRAMDGASLAISGSVNDKAAWALPGGYPPVQSVAGASNVSNSTSTVNVNMTVNATVREEADIDRISRKIAQQIKTTQRGRGMQL